MSIKTMRLYKEAGCVFETTTKRFKAGTSESRKFVADYYKNKPFSWLMSNDNLKQLINVRDSDEFCRRTVNIAQKFNDIQADLLPKLKIRFSPIDEFSGGYFPLKHKVKLFYFIKTPEQACFRVAHNKNSNNILERLRFINSVFHEFRHVKQMIDFCRTENISDEWVEHMALSYGLRSAKKFNNIFKNLTLQDYLRVCGIKGLLQEADKKLVEEYFAVKDSSPQKLKIVLTKMGKKIAEKNKVKFADFRDLVLKIMPKIPAETKEAKYNECLFDDFCERHFYPFKDTGNLLYELDASYVGQKMRSAALRAMSKFILREGKRIAAVCNHWTDFEELQVK